MKLLLPILTFPCFFAGSVSARDAATEPLQFFEKRIRPVLAEKCYKCHSADSEKLKGRLLLDRSTGEPIVLAYARKRKLWLFLAVNLK